MFLFKRKTDGSKTAEAIEAIRNDMDTMKAQMAAYQENVNTEIDAVKGSFNSLVKYLEEGPPGETEPAAERDALLPAITEEDIQNMKQDIMYMRRGIMDILEWIQTVDDQFKSIRSHIDGAQKDIKSKIAYSVSRLKM